MKISICKGCKAFEVYIMENKGKENKLKIEYIPILKDFKDIFLEISSWTSSEKRYKLYDRFGSRFSTTIKGSLSDEYSRSY